MIDYSLILTINYPNDQWSINNNDYNSLQWYSESLKPTKDQLDSQWGEVVVKNKKLLCKQEAKRRIAEYDWVIDTETTPDLLNRQDFIAYRSALRQLILNPVENPVWPEVPQEVWKND